MMVTAKKVILLVAALVGLIGNHGKVSGFPQMEACPNGPCATLFGPCVADSDCIGDNMACVDDMDSCMNMIAPCCQMAPAGRSGDLPTIVEAAVASPELSTLVAAVKAAGLVDTLSGEGPFTVFAPNNDAFAKIPAETLDDLLKPENVDQLTAILLRHVVPTVILAAEFPEDITSVDTVGGETITLNPMEATVESSAGKATVIMPDILASNGVIHIVDTVF